MGDNIGGGERQQNGPQAIGGMQMQAASAAMRMVRTILARLNSPHAQAAAQPLRPSLLWRQVARRMGFMPNQHGPRIGHVPGQPGSYNAPHLDFVWRMRHKPAPEPEADSWDDGWVFPNLASRRPPMIVGAPAVPVPLPIPTQNARMQMGAAPEQASLAGAPPAFVPAQAVMVEYTPGPAFVPPQPLVSPMLMLARPSLPISQATQASLAVASGAPVMIARQAASASPTSAPLLQEHAALLQMPHRISRSVSAEDEGSTQAEFIGNDAVWVAYTPPPMTATPQPLVSQAAPLPARPTLVAQPSLAERAVKVEARAPRNLGLDLNRDLVPTDDMLSRIIRTHEIELALPAQQAAPATPTALADIPPAPQAPPAATPAPPVQPAPAVAAPPVPQVSPVAMPLAAPPASPIAHAQARRAAAEEEARSQRGLFGRVMDRVTSSLPIPPLVTQDVSPSTPQVSAATPDTSPAMEHQDAPVPVGATAQGSSSQAVTASTSQSSGPSAQATTPATVTAPVQAVSATSASATYQDATLQAGTNPAPSPQDRGSQGLLGSIVARLLGRAESPSQAQGSRPPPVPMTWTRRGNQQATSEEQWPAEEFAASASPAQRPMVAPITPATTAPQVTPPVPGQIAAVSQENPAPTSIPAPTVVVAQSLQSASVDMPSPGDAPQIVEQAGASPAPIAHETQVAEAPSLDQQPAAVPVGSPVVVQQEQPVDTLTSFTATPEAGGLVPGQVRALTGTESVQGIVLSSDVAMPAQEEPISQLRPIMETAPRRGGLFGALIARLLGNQETSPRSEGQVGSPPALPMTWARRASQQPTGDEQWAGDELGSHERVSETPRTITATASTQAAPALPSSLETVPAQSSAIESSQASTAPVSPAMASSQEPGPTAIPATVQIGENVPVQYGQEVAMPQQGTRATPTAPAVQPLTVAAEAAPLPGQALNGDTPARRGGLFSVLIARLLGSGQAGDGPQTGANRPSVLSMPWARRAPQQTASEEQWDAEADAFAWPSQQPANYQPTPSVTTQQAQAPIADQPVRYVEAAPALVEQPTRTQADQPGVQPSVIPDLSSTAPDTLPVAVPVAAQPAQPGQQPSETLMDGAFAAPPIQAEPQPPYTAPADASAPQSVEAALPLDYASQAWFLMADMADDVARSHEPLSSLTPMRGAAQSNFLSRLLGGLGMSFRRGDSSASGELSGGTGRIAPLWRSLRPRTAQQERVTGGYDGAAILSSRSTGSTLPVSALVGQTLASDYTNQQAQTTYSGALSLPHTAGGVAGIGTAANSSFAYQGMPTMAASMYQPAALRRSTVMLPAGQMSQSLGDFLLADGAEGSAAPVEGGGDSSYYAQLLQQIYGGPQLDSQMPLAIPYGAFALPTGTSSSHMDLSYLLGGDGHGYQANYAGGGRVSQPSQLPMPIPSVPSFQQNQPVEYVNPLYRGGDSAPVAEITSHSWGVAGDNDSYSDSSDGGEATAWANVVSSAVSGSSSNGPSLSLAGQERQFTDANEEHHDPHAHKTGDEQDLDELAETVYTLLRRRLSIERERSF